MDSEEIRFGAFTLRPGRRQLLRGDTPVRIGQRALDLLIALARRPGEVLDRDALLPAIWPGRHVEDSNLRAQMAALRRALGEGEAEAETGHVLTIPGRGYSFVAPPPDAAPPGPAGPVPTAPAPFAPAPPELAQPDMAPLGTLPLRLQPVLGREADAALVIARLRERRFVSLIGAGGIGKTTLALSLARQLAPDYAQPPLFVDLGTLADGTLAAGRLLAALQAEAEARPGTARPASLGAALAGARRLVILDSCEPVIGAAAALAEQLLQAAPALHLLATSREPLRAEGEWSYRLPSMAAPPADAALGPEAALGFPAVALFVERLQAAGAAPPDAAGLALIAGICRQLDGIPLAIELAATRAAQLGLAALAARLDDRFRLLMQGRRTALPRHQTLRATLDWSHELLSPEEQRLLRRLAVFQGCFSLEAALAVGGGAEAADPAEAAALVDRLGLLVDKSFLALQARPGGTAYRCLDTTRLYLLQKLEEAGEAEAVALRHARHYAALFEAAELLWASLPVAEARARLAPDIDNLRTAIDWALGRGCQVETGIALTLAGVPLWSALGMVEEARDRLDTAIAAFRGEVEQDPRLGMRLYAALGTITVFLSGTLEAAWVNTLVFAERLGDVEHQLRALNGLALSAMRRDYREALAHARRFRDIAWREGQRDDGPVGDRLVGYILHMLGEQAEARRLTEAMLERYPQRALQPHQTKLNFYDQRILSKSTLARILWLQGESAAALALADETVEEARALGHPFSHFFALALSAAPLAYLAGDTARAATARATILAELRQVPGWVLWGEAYWGLEMTGEAARAEEGLALLRRSLAAMPDTAFSRRIPVFHDGLARAALRLGRPAEALAIIDAALADARGCGEAWYEPEYLRLRGDGLAALGAPEAEILAAYEAALALAGAQGARAWSLRAATSLARRRPAARDALAALLARLPPGEDTPDRRAALALLQPG
ncbi:winged helix-turn-helix domain-containing protein [Pseudoroseomonas cervicalis]|uniref:ATP-binding protein n=1 Tax=Teichococcus cervicalis TaxID=204525 RepID=UPI00278889EA|nr:winged helix-turn-helix domain-containing protein [Pseudoroseomonas cervicalis]MDQ1078083.1 putative ATPase/DNA-binding winged helix-turn-helix (wHTH) protein [Pseudoroseomonas cervicalis]